MAASRAKAIKPVLATGWAVVRDGKLVFCAPVTGCWFRLAWITKSRKEAYCGCFKGYTSTEKLVRVEIRVREVARRTRRGKKNGR